MKAGLIPEKKKEGRKAKRSLDLILSFEIDLKGTFGTCKCGWKKEAHDPKAERKRRLLSQAKYLLSIYSEAICLFKPLCLVSTPGRIQDSQLSHLRSGPQVLSHSVTSGPIFIVQYKVCSVY